MDYNFFVSVDFGGTLGLFLGASIISISEILEFLFDCVRSKLNGNRFSNRVTTVQVQGR
jgi:hypothetical protein